LRKRARATKGAIIPGNRKELYETMACSKHASHDHGHGKECGHRGDADHDGHCDHHGRLKYA
jgi:hypothetical protein